MASLGHIAIGLAAARVGRREPVTGLRLALSMLGWCLVSMSPDLDVIGFPLGIKYGDEWGHRGATHSFVFALVVGILIAGLSRWSLRPFGQRALVAIAVLASHPLLDILTDGGLGCALFWPFDLTRHFAPWTPIPVAPIGRAFFSATGLRVMLVELVIFLPLLIYALWPRVMGKRATLEVDPG